MFQEKIFDLFGNLLPNVTSHEQDLLNGIILEYSYSHNHGMRYTEM